MNRKGEQMPDLPDTALPDQVEQAGLDSFPASDPPSWSPMHLGLPANRTAAEPSGHPAHATARSPAASDAGDETPASDADMTNQLSRVTSG